MPRVSVIAALLALAAAAPAHAAPEHAEIAFASDGRIWASRADGSERRLLVSDRPALQPVWSPDGSALAYVTATDDRGRLMVLDAGGTRAVTPLRNGIVDHTPAWSPDGKALVFTRYSTRTRRHRSSIVVRDFATGAERVLASEPVLPRLTTLTQPSWSPDGATIAYTRAQLDRDHDIRPTIRTIPAGGGASTLLIGDAQSPDWSPDGSRLAFASVRDRNGTRCSSDECWFAGELYTAAADGGDLKRLTRNEGDDRAPRWSPDGTRILFTSDRNLPEGDTGEVYSVAPDGTCLTWLTNGTPASGYAAWRPGSGSRFDPGSCDPAMRAPAVDPPRLPRRPGLWLGPRYGDLGLSRVRNGIAFYDDCLTFDRCPPMAYLFSEPACRGISYRALRRYKLLELRGALVAYYPGTSRAIVYSGRSVTSLDVGRGRLAAVRRAVRLLRPYNAARSPRRLAAPRLRRSLRSAWD